LFIPKPSVILSVTEKTGNWTTSELQNMFNVTFRITTVFQNENQ